MNYNQNFKITLWEEFKGPILTVSFASFLMIGLHNTFYTTLSVDSKKVNVAWNSNNIKSQSAESIVVQEREYVASSNAIESNTKNFSNTNANTIQNDQVNEQSAATVDAHKEEYAVINTDISVSAAEFYHPKLTTVLSGSAISGYLEVQGGEVKGLSVNINSDKTKDIGIQMISMGESQLQGNIFVYEIDGQNYTGTIYPTSPTEYMVSFVNGPWNGARVKFSTQEQHELQNENGGEQLYDQDSYSAPETDMTRREWASEEVSSQSELQTEQLDSQEQTVITSEEGNISVSE